MLDFVSKNPKLADKNIGQASHFVYISEKCKQDLKYAEFVSVLRTLADKYVLVKLEGGGGVNPNYVHFISTLVLIMGEKKNGLLFDFFKQEEMDALVKEVNSSTALTKTLIVNFNTTYWEEKFQDCSDEFLVNLFAELSPSVRSFLLAYLINHVFVGGSKWANYAKMSACIVLEVKIV